MICGRTGIVGSLIMVCGRTGNVIRAGDLGCVAGAEMLDRVIDLGDLN
jgi:hypothetical protein